VDFLLYKIRIPITRKRRRPAPTATPIITGLGSCPSPPRIQWKKVLKFEVLKRREQNLNTFTKEEHF